MGESGQGYKRKTHLIKKDFQIRFILKFCLLLFLGALLSTGLLLLLSQDSLTSSFQSSRLTIKNTGLAILPSVIYTNLVTFGLVTLGTIGVTLFFSHKIAGPLHRIEKELKHIGNGDLTKTIMLRGKDQIGTLAGCVNDMTADLRAKVLDIQNDVKEIQNTASISDVPSYLTNELNRLAEKIETHFRI
jgi:methyl-accepting chemotaxis protein